MTLLLLILLTLQTSAHAAAPCTSFFLIEHLESPHHLPLPASTVHAIQKHPIFAWAKSLDPSNQMKFIISPQQNFGGTFQPFSVGEEIQATYLRKVIKVLFPDAPQGASDSPLSFRLKVRDSLEGKEASSARNSADYIDMPLIKAANGSLSSLDKHLSRQQLGIDPSQKVGILYSPTLIHKDQWIGRNPSYSAVYRNLKKNGLTSFILSPNPRGLRGKPHEILQNLRTENPGFLEQFDQVIFLSKAQASTPLMPANKKILVINDTTGKLPYLYSASDLAVIQGPINPLESVTVGTPTVVFLNEKLVGGYGFQEYKRIVDYGVATGRAQAAHDITQFDQAIQKVTRYEGPVLTPDQVEVEGATSLDRFLDVLQDKLKRQADSLQRP